MQNWMAEMGNDHLVDANKGMAEMPIPEDLRDMYHFAIAWRHEFGSERRYGAGTVEMLIERIAKAEQALRESREEVEKLYQTIMIRAHQLREIVKERDDAKKQLAELSKPVMVECSEPQVFSDRRGMLNAVVCSCGFATTYTAMIQGADALGMKHFHMMHDAHRASRQPKASQPEDSK